jgi:hypothetical protein
MTRLRPAKQAAGTPTKRRAGARAVSVPASMKFLAFEENGGAFHWAIFAATSDRLVQSASSASYEGAKQAGGIVPARSGAAPFEDRANDSHPLEVAARREAAMVRHDLDAERWLDRRGSFNSEVVTRWPSRR